MEENETIVLLVLVGALIMVSLALVVIFFVTQHRKKYLVQQNEILRVKSENEQSLLRAVISTQEEERTRIGMNLHDTVGADLSMLKLNLSRYIQDVSRPFNPALFRKEIDNLEVVIDNVRGVVKDLYPKSLQVYGFIMAFGGVVDRLSDTQAVKATFNSTLHEAILELDYATKLDLYRVCQEVLNNLIKYSECKELKVEVTQHNDQLAITFTHDGVSFLDADAERLIAQNTGIGLKSIKNRINLIKGKINYLRHHNKSVIEISVPLKND